MSKAINKNKCVPGKIVITVLLLVFVLMGIKSVITDASYVKPRIAAGTEHTVVLMPDGTVKSWGRNSNGQLGNGTTTASNSPVMVSGLGGTVTAIAAGDLHTVALMSDGTVKSWGSNTFGQLGNGTGTSSSTPVPVSNLGGTVTAVSGGIKHTVALMSDGTVKAWGWNDFGQLGNGTNTASNTPVTVSGLGGTVIAIAAGGDHTVALMSDGTVKAWGDNGRGQLGNGGTTASSTPVTVIGLGGTVTAIAAAKYNTVVLMSDGTVKTWGWNSSGQLGNGSTLDSSTPVTVTDLGGTATGIAVSTSYAVALMSDGTVKAWGDNGLGQLGDDSTTNSKTPVTVTGLGGTVASIAVGIYHTVGLMSDGTVKTWGYNGEGQLGNGSTTSSSTPVNVIGLSGTVLASKIAAGQWHSVALMSDSSVKAWGYNGNGQLGNGSTTNSSTPVTVTGLAGTVTAIAAGSFHNLALMSDGAVKAWGNNYYGQLGNGNTSDSSTPVTVTGLGGRSKQSRQATTTLSR